MQTDRMSRQELEEEVKRLLPGCVLVTPAVLRRIIRSHRRYPGFLPEGLHAEVYLIPLHELERLPHLEDLQTPVSGMDDPVLLMAAPEESELAERRGSDALIHLWRRVLHLKVYLHFHRLVSAGRMTEAVARQRIHRIGQPEFDEIRRVLRRQGRLLRPLDKRLASVEEYVELVAFYLELRRFEPAVVPMFFSGLARKPELPMQVIEEDLGDSLDEIVEGSRPAGAPEAAASYGASGDKEEEEGSGPAGMDIGDGGAQAVSRRSASADVLSRRRLEAALAEARRCESRKNLVRAAFLYAQAGAVGGQDPEGLRAEARRCLDELGSRIARLLSETSVEGKGPTGEGPGTEHGEESKVAGEGLGTEGPGTESKGEAWASALEPLLHRATVSGLRGPEGLLLYDLQKACGDGEAKSFRVDLVEWLLWLGRRPIRRPLDCLLLTLPLRHVRSASVRLSSARIGKVALQEIEALMGSAREILERRLRSKIGPVLEAAVEKAGILAGTAVQAAARKKLVAELLDLLAERGFFGFSELRDAVARNQAKLEDLRGPLILLKGDELLRLDTELSTPLEGAYRRAETYLRWLQRLSSCLFGTAAGRLLSMYVLLPFLGSFVALAGLGHVLRPLIRWTTGASVRIATTHSVLAGMLLLGLLINWPAFRRKVMVVLRAVGRFCVTLLWVWPRRFLSLPLVERVVRSRVFFALGQYAIKPALLVTPFWAVLAFAIFPAGGWSGWRWPGFVGLWAVTSVFLSLPAGRRFAEWALEGSGRVWRRLRYHLVPGLIRWVLFVFETFLAMMERLFYLVDEWLRFRQGESRPSYAVKCVLGLLWFALTYVVRIYIRVLVEPQVNPVKHFPVVTVSHKVILPMTFTLTRWISVPFMPLGPIIANTIAVSTVFLLPGMFGFLCWEMKENYRLYQKNRHSFLVPVAVGGHGETVVRLLRPGLHSGTLVKLHNTLCRAETGRALLGKARARRRALAGLHHVEQAVRRFVRRDVLFLVHGSRVFGERALGVLDVHLASNQIGIAMGQMGSSSDLEDLPLVKISLEEQSGWLVAGVEPTEAFMRLEEQKRLVLEIALHGMLKLAGVDLLRQRIEELLPAGAPYDVSDQGLVVWPGQDYRVEAVFRLDRDAEILVPKVQRTEAGSEEMEGLLPWTIKAGDLFFGRERLLRSDWERVWEEISSAGFRDESELSCGFLAEARVLARDRRGAGKKQDTA